MTALSVPVSRRTFVRWRTPVAPIAAPDEITNPTRIAPVVDASAEVPGEVSAELAPKAAAVVEAETAPALAIPSDTPVPATATAPAAPARGAVFSGTKAQIRLAPSKAATHPTSGRRGDLFVDGAARLWFCTSGGKKATWKQVKLV